MADEEDDDATDQLAYENEEWDSGDRDLLSQLLRAEEVPHAWEATTLVVDAADEEAVDRILEQVEAASLPVLDPEAPKVVYELEGWDERRRGELADALNEAGLAHGWDDEDDLVVLETDEDAVDPIVERIEVADPNALDDENGDGGTDQDPSQATAAEDDDGLAAQDAMSELFVAADRLMHDPDDHEAVLRLVDATRLTESLVLPYGFSAEDWDPLVRGARELRDLLEAEDADDDGIIASATDLRGRLRRYV